MPLQDEIIANQSWIEEVWDHLTSKMPYAVQKARENDYIPYTAQNGEWQEGPMDGICWWSNGFWPAAMWQMYLHTGDEIYKEEAIRAENALDVALNDFERLSHDVGFLWLITSGVNFRLTGSEQSRKRLLLAANLLAARFNPLGFIRAWNGGRAGWAIIDCMMNIPLLYWASAYTGDPRYRKMATAHADTTQQFFVRPDGSVHHIVMFDPDTMHVLGTPAGQGYAPGSSWSRGQAWAIYGFALSHIHTGKQEYLDTAKRIAHYFIACVQEDWVPRCDFRQPGEPDIRDSSAGVIAACGLLELAGLVPEAESDLYAKAAIRLLQAADSACADWRLSNPAILHRCTASYHNGDHHIPIIYGDYFFIEAMGKLKGEKLSFWQAASLG